MSEAIKEAISLLVGDEEVSGDLAESVAREIMGGEATPAQIASFVTALRLRGETVDQIVAFTRVMREKATPLTVPEGPILDTCGTGGDGANTFNISTTAAFIAAGAGVTVAKHGNRGVSSGCGSADVLAALGVNVEAPVSVTEKCLAEIGIGFMFAPLYHAAMKHAIGPRREIGVRTIFNMLGPLSNPAGATNQIIGVYDTDLTEVFCQVLRDLGSRRALVVHGSDGLDEITTAEVTEISELKDDGSIVTYVLEPADLGLAVCEVGDLAGGSAEDNAADIRGILEGRTGAKTDVALLNAAAGIYVAGRANSIGQGLEEARRSVSTGAALQKLEDLERLTNA